MAKCGFYEKAAVVKTTVVAREREIAPSRHASIRTLCGPCLRRPGARWASPPRLGTAICRSASAKPGASSLSAVAVAPRRGDHGRPVARRRSPRGLGRSLPAWLLRGHDAPCNRSPRGSPALRSESYASLVTQRWCSSTESLRATATTARFLALFPPRAASFSPCLRRSESSPKGPSRYWALPTKRAA